MSKQYNRPLTRRICTRTKESTYNQKQPTFTTGATLWASVELTEASQPELLGRLQSQVTATFRIQNRPTLLAQDHLIDKLTSQEYRITGIQTMPNELVVSALLVPSA